MATKRSDKTVTIRNVADQAGVSISTVSRVLNDRAGVGERTRRAVQKTIEELNFQPDLAARELVSRRAVTVGWSDARDARRLHFFATLMREHLFAKLYREGYRVEDVPTGDDGLPSYLTDVMILVTPHPADPRFTYLSQKNVPFVVSGVTPQQRSAGPDDYDGGKQVAQHLLQLGHQNISVLAGKRSANENFLTPSMVSGYMNKRVRGFLDTLERAGVKTGEVQVLHCDYSSLGAFLTLRHALEAGLRVTAVFALSDEMALGAVAALNDKGLSVPEDVSVVGFDDMPEIGSNLTTVRQDIPLFAATLADLAGEAVALERPRQVTLPVQLVVRGTTELAKHAR